MLLHCIRSTYTVLLFHKILKSSVVEMLTNSSIELTTNGRDTIEAAARVLPPGMAVFVPKLPRQSLADKLVQIRLLHEFGLEPVPHIAARQLNSERELQSFLQSAVREAGVKRVLVIGGDNTDCSGPFPDSASVIASQILSDSKLTAIHVAGYPDGHPRISAITLREDLDLKLKLADDQNLDISVVTQFSFAPAKIAEYCANLSRSAPGISVFAGMAGPTSISTLLRYAKICGVGTSLKAMNSLGMNAIKLAMHSTPDKQLAVLDEQRSRGETGNLCGIHLFSFGGFIDSADWLSRKLERIPSIASGQTAAETRLPRRKGQAVHS
jgi:methylenetetrahydrofolate reductase (NADPH)